MIRIESRTGQGGSTPRLHQKEIGMEKEFKEQNLFLMGAKQDRLTVSREVENCRMTPLLVKLVNANDNFASEDYALAA